MTTQLQRHLAAWLVLLTALTASAQGEATLCKQVQFDHLLPAGNYSGIAYMGGDTYAVANDKSANDGYAVFQISIDSITGEILSVSDRGFRGDSLPSRDDEGIAWLPGRGTLLVVGEADSRIVEYDTLGVATGRSLKLLEASKDFGYESLTYNEATRTLWTCTEHALEQDETDTEKGDAAIIRLQAFDEQLQPKAQYAYLMDVPLSNKPTRHYAHGVSEMTALDSGDLLVMEREFAVPNKYIGATVTNKIYRVTPCGASMIADSCKSAAQAKPLTKTMVCQWQTRLTLLGRSLANYEGMCLGPRLANGKRVIVLVADSQNRIKGVLHDWMRTLVIDE